MTGTRPPEAGVTSSTAMVTMSLTAGVSAGLSKQFISSKLSDTPSLIHRKTSKGTYRKRLEESSTQN
jgi:hypothetical protein